MVTKKEEEEVAKTTEKVANRRKAAATSSGKVLVKMTHPFQSFDVPGKEKTVYVFTRENPFVLMDEDDAEEFFKIHRDGHFRPAYPDEVREFYA